MNNEQQEIVNMLQTSPVHVDLAEFGKWLLAEHIMNSPWLQRHDKQVRQNMLGDITSYVNEEELT